MLHDASMDGLSISIRKAIVDRDEVSVRSLSRYYALALGMWSEVLLLKVLHERRAFSFEEIERILRLGAAQRWEETVKSCFRKHFKRVELSELTLRPDAFNQYQTIVKALRTELVPTISLRNCLAHGQLRYTLREDLACIDERLMRQLRGDNFLTLSIKRRILLDISRVVRSLAIWHKNFGEHFNEHFYRVVHSVHKVKSTKQREYDAYSEMLRSRSERGREHRRNNEAKLAK